MRPTGAAATMAHARRRVRGPRPARRSPRRADRPSRDSEPVRMEGARRRGRRRPVRRTGAAHRGPGDQHGGALTVYGRIHNRASGATEKPAVSCGGGGRRRPTSGCALRSRGAYPRRMATEPPSKHGRQPRRPRHFAPYRFARFVLVVLALIGVAALALLVLGLLNVEVVT